MELEIQRVKRLWDTWDIRVFLITSLLIQILLSLLAPYRKRCTSKLLSACIWLLYLGADAVALFSIGLISSNQGNAPHNSELLSFWAPFLLLHLGGPDAITALALEDNELWLRHALQLATQACVTIYVFGKSVQTHNHLWVPTVLMFVDGFIKYTERASALYFSSSETYKNSITTIEKLDRERLPLLTQFMEVSETQFVLYAYYCYKLFKGVIVDSALTFETRDTSREFFLSISPREALKIIEIELHLMNDVFHTKISVLLQGKKVYFILARGVSFLSVVTSLWLFIVKDKSNYHQTDIGITYYLLIGALMLDIYAGLRILTSDWWIIMYKTSALGILFLDCSLLGSIPRALRYVFASSKRWSQSMSQYNLLERCSRELPTYFNYIFIQRIRDALIGWLYVRSVPIHEKLVDFIIKELQKKAKLTTDDISGAAIDEIRSARGNLVFQEEYSNVSEILKPWTVDLEYAESLIIWHAATEICYRSDISYQKSQKKDIVDEDGLFYQLISKQLSDYMAYIILKQQPVVSSITGFSDILFDNSISHGQKLMRSSGITKRPILAEGEDHYESVVEQLSAWLLTVQGDGDADVEGSVFSKARKLAREIQMLGLKKWEITSKVWVELLCYAAIRSSPRFQVVRLNSGGELITIVWLFLTHLGLAGQFQRFDRATMLDAAAELRRHFDPSMPIPHLSSRKVLIAEVAMAARVRAERAI